MIYRVGEFLRTFFYVLRSWFQKIEREVHYRLSICVDFRLSHCGALYAEVRDVKVFLGPGRLNKFSKILYLGTKTIKINDVLKISRPGHLFLWAEIKFYAPGLTDSLRSHLWAPPQKFMSFRLPLFALKDTCQGISPSLVLSPKTIFPSMNLFLSSGSKRPPSYPSSILRCEVR